MCDQRPGSSDPASQQTGQVTQDDQVVKAVLLDVDLGKLAQADVSSKAELKDLSSEEHIINGYRAAASHLALAQQDEDVRKHMGHVKTGAFTSKRDQLGYVKVTSIKNLAVTLETFYTVAEKLQSAEQAGLELVVYRAIYVGEGNLKPRAIEAMPSSTSFSLDFVKEWAKNREGKYKIFRIIVPASHLKLVMSYPGEIPKDGPPPVNQAQQEVTLGPGMLSFDTEALASADDIVDCRIEAISFKDCVDLIRQDASHELSPKEMRACFDSMRAYFRQHYTTHSSFSFDGSCSDIKLTETTTADESSFVYIRESVEHCSFTANLAFDEQSATITYAFIGEDTGENAERIVWGPYKITAKTVGKYFSAIMSLKLHDSESFETLPTPERWFPPSPPEEGTS